MFERMRGSQAALLLVALLVGVLLLGGCGRERATAPPPGFTQLASEPLGDGVRMTTYQGSGPVTVAMATFVLAAERDGWKASEEQFSVTEAVLAPHGAGADLSVRVLTKGRDVQLLTVTRAGEVTMVVRLTGPQDRMGDFYGRPGDQAAQPGDQPPPAEPVKPADPPAPPPPADPPKPADPTKPAQPPAVVFPAKWLELSAVPDLLNTFALFEYNVMGFTMRYRHEGMEDLGGQRVHKVKVTMDDDQFSLWVAADGRTVKALENGEDFPGDPNDIGTMMLRDGFLAWLQDNLNEVRGWQVVADNIRDRSVEQQAFGGRTYEVHKLRLALPFLIGVVEVHYVNLGDRHLVTRRAMGEDAFQVTDFALR